jgi:hypothetical protein
MEVLVHLMCDCGLPRVACPECRDRGSISLWLPLELLPGIERPYIILNRRYVPTPRADNMTTNSTSVPTLTTGVISH